jgi:hypothetical protein
MHTDPINRDYKKGTPDNKHGISDGSYGNWKVYTEGVLTAVYEGDWNPIARICNPCP